MAPDTDGSGSGTPEDAGAGPAEDAGCRLCDLPVGADPGVDGQFCCQGCFSVARRLGEVDPAGAPAGTDAGARPAVDPDATEPEERLGAGDVDGAEAFLAVDGMHCTTCESFLAARATDHDGVRAADASYAADLLRVVYDPAAVAESDFPGIVSGAGYEARLVADADDADPGRTQEETLGRLIVGRLFGMLVMLWYVLFLYPTYLGIDPATLPLDLSGIAGTYLLWNL